MLFYMIEVIFTAEDIEMPKIRKETTKIKIGFAS